MTDGAWRKLHELHFPELPLDCGTDDDPGIVYGPDLRDWSNKATTPDQRRMECYIDRYDLRQKRALHIGIGNSSLARRFHRRVGEIVGTTIDEPEIGVAQALGLPNYRIVIHNKYSGMDDVVPGKFDFILDNNPTSPCCCVRHLFVLFTFYADRLADGGQVVTDQLGLQWVPDGSNPRWRFNFDDLSIVAAEAGLSACRANKTVYVLSRSPPPAPGLAALARHLVRRVWMLPGQIARNGPQSLSRMSRRLPGTPRA
ncbi:MAG: hypothetical protein QOE50_212 [Sphingomonadales bacterium]|jgi:hypothetical protein|nr:hypothetical protein [Sphingomonadales bacterium]